MSKARPTFDLLPPEIGVESLISELCVLGQTPNFLHPYRAVVVICKKLTDHFLRGNTLVSEEEWAAVDPAGRRLALFLLARESSKTAVRLAKIYKHKI